MPPIAILIYAAWTVLRGGPFSFIVGKQLHYPPRWVLIPALVWETFPVGLRRDRQLLERRPAVPGSGQLFRPYKVADRRTPAARMSQREFANQTALIVYAEQNDLAYEYEYTPAFAKWQRLLSGPAIAHA